MDDDSKLDRTEHSRLGDFQIVRRIGQGGMGVVYEAVQESLGRHVALKLLPAEALLDPKKLERFRREAKSAAKLHHTNIVPVFGTGEADGRHFYAMQFISGHPLDAVIDEMNRLKRVPAPAGESTRTVERELSAVAAALATGTFAVAAVDATPTVTHAPMRAEDSPPTVTHTSKSPGDSPSATPVPSATSDAAGPSRSLTGGRSYWAAVARIGAQVADALAYAHKQGVLHRDIKPANLLLDPVGCVWVTDFGLAKSTDAEDLTHAGDIVGTLRYMAPERFDGQGDHRADVYALGLTLYELLTLTPAFAAENRAKLVEQVLAASPPRPRSIVTTIPRDLETVILKAIARDPAMRYQSAGELAEDLRRFIEDRPIRARRASSAEQAWRWCRRNPAVASLVTAVLLVFAAGAAAATFFAMQAERKERDARTEAGRADGERDRANAKSDELRESLYASDMNLVQAAWDADNVGRVVELLERQVPRNGDRDLRGFEWHYWMRQCRGDLGTTRLSGLNLNSWRVVFSADGTHIAAPVESDRRFEVHVWDTATGKLLLRLADPAFENRFTDQASVSLSPDGTRIAVSLMTFSNDASEKFDSVLKVWDVTTGHEIWSKPLTAPVAAFNADGTHLATVVTPKLDLAGKVIVGEKAAIKIWNLATGRETRAISLESGMGAISLAFRPDGNHLAALVLTELDPSELGRKIKVWNLADGREILSTPNNLVLHNLITYSPDGTRIATGGLSYAIESGRATVWNASDGKEIVALKGADSGVRQFAFSPDGTRIVGFGDDSTAMVWDAPTGELRLTLKGHTGEVMAAAFGRDGTRVFTVGTDGTLKVWDATARDETRERNLGHGYFSRTAISANGTRLAACSFTQMSSKIRVMDPAGQEIQHFEVKKGSFVQGLAFSPNGRQLAGAIEEGGVWRCIVWDVADGKEKLTLTGLFIGPHLAAGGAVAFSPDGTRLAAFFSADRRSNGPAVAVLKVWDAAAGREVFSVPREFTETEPVAFSPDGKYLVSSDGRRDGNFAIKLCDAETGRDVRTFVVPGDYAGRITFSPDGKRLATASNTKAGSGQIYVWDTATGQILLTLKGHAGWEKIVAFSPDGRRIATSASPKGSSTGQVKLWDDSGRELLTLKHDGVAFNLTFSADGSRLSAALTWPSNPPKVAVRSWNATPLFENN